MKTGNFGKVREAYAQARRAFPEEAIDYIFERIAIPAPAMLDIGCGTGIGTRQLSERGASVTGSDIDADMIEKARQASSDISYAVAPAHQLPFQDSRFTAVTAFSAFHWFRDERSLAEIKRVLEEGGKFFVINKNDVGGFQKDHRRKLATLLGKKLPSPKDSFDPAQILENTGFSDIRSRIFQTEEHFSPAGALRHIQSTGVWNEVPAEREAEAIQLMRNHIARHIKDGQAVRNLEIIVVSGQA